MILSFMPSLKYIDGIQVIYREIEESKQILKMHKDELEVQIPFYKDDEEEDEEKDYNIK